MEFGKVSKRASEFVGPGYMEKIRQAVREEYGPEADICTSRFPAGQSFEIVLGNEMVDYFDLP